MSLLTYLLIRDDLSIQNIASYLAAVIGPLKIWCRYDSQSANLFWVVGIFLRCTRVHCNGAHFLCCIWSLIIPYRVFKCTWSLFHHFMTLQGITSTDLPIRIYARAYHRPRDYNSQTHAGYYLECRHPLLKCQMITKYSFRNFVAYMWAYV